MEPLSLKRTKNKNVSKKVKWSRYNIEVNQSTITNGSYLLYNSLTGRLIASKNSFSEMKDFFDKNPVVQDDNQLLRLGFLVPEDLNELAYSRYKFEHKDKRHQSLTILPTEQCNFRCTYCYEDFEKGKMEPKLQESIVSWVDQNSSHWDSISISWFGGEPLVAYDVIKYISQNIIKICNERNISYNASMTTNGSLLTLKRAKELYDLGVGNYQITLDGPEEIHDMTRILFGGQGTYQKIIKNLREIKNSDLDVSITIRNNFDKVNSDKVSDLLTELAREFSDDKRFSFRLHAIGKWGGPNDEDLPICTQNESHKVIMNSSYEALEKGIRAINATTGLQPNNVCYAALPNSLVIGSDGIIYKCTVAFDLPVNQVGKLFEDGKIEIDVQKFSQWVSNDGLTDNVCKNCEIHPICHGATCPLIRIEKDIRPCPPYKNRMEEYITLLYKEMQYS